MVKKVQATTFSRNLRYYLNKNNCSQKKAAELLGVSGQRINTWYKGNAIPRPEMIKKLAELLQISIDDLMYETISIEEAELRQEVTDTEKIFEFLETNREYLTLVKTVCFIDKKDIELAKGLMEVLINRKQQKKS